MYRSKMTGLDELALSWEEVRYGIWNVYVSFTEGKVLGLTEVEQQAKS